MKLETTFFHSKLARRIFWLFILCALVPITVLAVISLRNVSAQLKEQTTRELRQVSREEAMGIHERLSFLDANMRLAALRVRNPADNSSLISSDASQPFSGLAGKLEGLQVVTPDGLHRTIFGNSILPVSYTTQEQAFLHAGQNVLSTISCGQPDPCILLSQALDKNDTAEGLLVAEIRSSFLWDAENFAQPMYFCVLDPSAAPLFCSGPAPQRFPSAVTSNFSGQFEWQRDRREYLASFWNLPLKSSFFVSRWTIISSEAKADVFAPLMRFRTSFLLVFLLAFWIVLLLSLIQIRRNLVPLASLNDATRRISLGEFQARVAIDSGDEFEELAASFNSMASKIERQLKALAVVDDIDRAILSAWNPSRIISKVCSRLHELLPCDSVCVVQYDKSSSLMVLTQVFTPGSDSPEHTETIQLTPQELAALHERREVSVLAEDGAQAKYLKYLAVGGMQHFLAVPVLSGKGPSAIFILGHATAPVWTREDREHAKHLADQIAVAFSNSQLLTELEQVQWDTLTALARAIDAKSSWTLGHSERVTDVAIKIAQAMGLPPRELDVMRRGGLLHDIGKIGTPAEILDKPGKLTDEETKIMRDHVNIGVRILQPISGLTESMSIVAQHHEWVNGGGYPNGLAGDAVTLHARIFAVADCFDALVSDRPYRPGMPIARVMEILGEGEGKQFDPHVLRVFRAMLAAETDSVPNAEAPGPLVEVR